MRGIFSKSQEAEILVNIPKCISFKKSYSFCSMAKIQVECVRLGWLVTEGSYSSFSISAYSE